MTIKKKLPVGTGYLIFDEAKVYCGPKGILTGRSSNCVTLTWVGPPVFTQQLAERVASRDTGYQKIVVGERQVNIYNGNLRTIKDARDLAASFCNRMQDELRDRATARNRAGKGAARSQIYHNAHPSLR